MSQFNSQSVIDSAELQLTSNGIQAAQTVFQSALLDWVDDITMGDDCGLENHAFEGAGSGTHMASARREVANLWLAYANFNRKLNLFKSATEVYDQAISCPVVGATGKIWLEYASYLEERGKPRTAQTLYLRALIGEGNKGPAVKNPDEQSLLWNEFLRMMQTTRKNPNLTLGDLKDAAERDRLAQVPGLEVATLPNTLPKDNAAEGRPAKRSRWDKKTTEETLVLNPSSIETAASIIAVASKNMPSEIETLWHARDGGSIPSAPEPPLFTASPPKLGDPSGKDLVGDGVALQLLRMLTAKTHDGKCIGSALLDLCNACWMMVALKEDEVSKAHEKLEKKISVDLEELEANLDARASVAGRAIAAVEQANAHERDQFNMHCSVLRDQLQASSAWEFRKLLYSQQIVLSSAQIPGFDGPTVDSTAIQFQAKVCSVLHSAFYLRARVGDTSHVNMLNKQIERLKKIVATQPVAVQIEPTETNYNVPFQFQQQVQFQHPMSSSLPYMYSIQPQQYPMMEIPPVTSLATPNFSLSSAMPTQLLQNIGHKTFEHQLNEYHG